MNTPKYIHYITIALAVIGVFLEAANLYMPFIAQYIPNAAHSGEMVIGFAIVTKQVLLLIENKFKGPVLFMLLLLPLSTCQTGCANYQASIKSRTIGITGAATEAGNYGGTVFDTVTFKDK